MPNFIDYHYKIDPTDMPLCGGLRITRCNNIALNTDKGRIHFERVVLINDNETTYVRSVRGVSIDRDAIGDIVVCSTVNSPEQEEVIQKMLKLGVPENKTIHIRNRGLWSGWVYTTRLNATITATGDVTYEYE